MTKPQKYRYVFAFDPIIGKPCVHTVKRGIATSMISGHKFKMNSRKFSTFKVRGPLEQREGIRDRLGVLRRYRKDAMQIVTHSKDHLDVHEALASLIAISARIDEVEHILKGSNIQPKAVAIVDSYAELRKRLLYIIDSKIQYRTKHVKDMQLFSIQCLGMFITIHDLEEAMKDVELLRRIQK